MDYPGVASFLIPLWLHLSRAVSCFDCGEPPLCSCLAWMQTVSCYGPGVVVFPEFDQGIRNRYSHIDIIGTNITSLDTLDPDRWPSIGSLDIRGNIHLNCDRVLDMTEKNSHVVVISDCDDWPSRAILERGDGPSISGDATETVAIILWVVTAAFYSLWWAIYSPKHRLGKNASRSRSTDEVPTINKNPA